MAVRGLLAIKSMLDYLVDAWRVSRKKGNNDDATSEARVL